MNQDQSPQPQAEKGPYIIGIGASAGGVQQLQNLFSKISPQSQSIFIVVQHLPKDNKSYMDSLIRSQTSLEVQVAQQGMKLAPQTIFLIPPGRHLTVGQGRFIVHERLAQQMVYHPINTLFYSLAQEYGARSVGVVLSGSGSDGAQGLEAIKKEGGYTLAESLESAPFKSMPQAAIQTEQVDFIGDPEKIANSLNIYEKNHQRQCCEQKISDEGGLQSQSDFREQYLPIIELLKKKFKIDFSVYKPSTIIRRLHRRMEINQLSFVPDYGELLSASEQEACDLLDDLLIGVTEFFRDEEAFETIKKHVIPAICQQMQEEEEIRLWTPACATGEETYSLAMLFLEYIDEHRLSCRFRAIGSDVLKAPLTIANQGRYEAQALYKVPAHLKAKYFTQREDGLFQVTPELRECTLFAPHNMIENPPFTKMHMVSCRNFLIYLSAEMQKKVLSMLHFSLKIDGFLFLGASESLNMLADDFDIINRQWKVFRKKSNFTLDPPYLLSSRYLQMNPSFSKPSREEGRRTAVSTEHLYTPREADHGLLSVYDLLLEKYLPPSLLFSENLNLIHITQQASQYIQLSGRPSKEMKKILLPELRGPVREGILKSSREGEAIELFDIEVCVHQQLRLVNITVRPYALGSKQYYLVSFANQQQQAQHQEKKPPLRADKEDADHVQYHTERLEDELNLTKHSLQCTIEELEVTNEELQASNEELQASNEELQSTNEELHSLNEELNTVNAEYQEKIEALSRLNEDLENLYNSTQIATVFLDKNNLVRKFSPMAKNIFNLLKRDIGRPLSDIQTVILEDKLQKPLNQCIESPGEYRVESRFGQIYLMRVIDYQSDLDQPHEQGRVVSFIDLTDSLKEARGL